MTLQPWQVRLISWKVDTMPASFRQQLIEQKPLFGLFYKTACHQGIEILGTTGINCIVIDAEHAPFSANQLDVCLLAAKAAYLPVLVRIPDNRSSTILSVLDLGATGILAPHITTPEQAEHLVAAAKYQGGHRGCSNSPRAGSYGEFSLTELVQTSDKNVAVLGQIEDRQAVDAIEEIASVSGLDCLFIGPADLAISYGHWNTRHPEVLHTIEHIADVSFQQQKSVGIFLPNLIHVPQYRDMGIQFFIIGSDQSLLKRGAKQLAQTFHHP